MYLLKGNFIRDALRDLCRMVKKKVTPVKTSRPAKKVAGAKKAKKKSKEIVQLGKRIKFLRNKKGYSNYEYFAYEHEISRSQFGRYENGEDMRFSSLIRVIKALDMTLEEFFSKGFD
ncbi:MAG: helix-turn-helix transcriptional regulator [Candidatus Pedobacter colombiensis]|uniref:Helix-turn-helix transcriptional regulator n=1 Tax=Candidatus Pedobacter colombiensis TaxID=3121371 RepID=A0AAJ5W6F2_9SPHI|nr:helix-turn-helix transcriptional regulator [Pedobacter sp.]WEK18864.1 MAG: helix-turn-helix transcriptional regulator [Pedobacter sp.]